VGKENQLPEIVKISREKTIPLSFAQQQLWLLDQVAGESPHYNEFSVLKIEGSLIFSALQQSLTELVKRHEILRTIFLKWNGSPVQKIMPASTILLPVVNLQGLSALVKETEVCHLSTREAQQPFDLAKGPLCRFTLLQLDAESYILFITIHHIIHDGWSSGILIKEMGILYDAFAKGLVSPLPELPIQYADFAYWQRQWLNEDALKIQLAYWQQQLADIPTLLELPLDKPRTTVQTFQGDQQTIDIESKVLEKLKTLSQQSGTSLFMLFLATFVTLLYRYSGQEDIVVGSPIANRNHPALEPLIGYFVNILVLRTKLSGNLSFIDLLTQVKQMTLDAYAHQDMPFEQLVEVLKPERNLSYNPLFQVAFVFQNIRGYNDIQWSNNLDIQLLEREDIPARFDLTLYIEERQDGLSSRIEYNTDLFQKDTIIRMVGHFQTLLVSIVTNPTQSITELSILTEAEQHQLIEWNNTTKDYPKDKTIVDFFEQQVENTPNNVAVIFEEQSLSYQRLNQQANQLAHALIALGVQSNTLVGICVERSLEMVVGLLGILKAGGAYVPLDPDYPQERLRFMLEDSSVRVLLSQNHLLNKLPAVSTAKVICLDNEWEQIVSHHPGQNPARQSGTEDLAYMIYTSGSTGRPKGAMNLHQGICNRLLWMQDTYQLTITDNVLQKNPF
jgi:hypothetical protein